MNESLHLYLSGGGATLRREHGLPWRRRVTPAGQGGWDGADLGAAALDLGPAGRRWGRRALHVHLGSALCRFMVAALPAGLRDDAERQAAAAAQMRLHLGLDGAAWVFALDAAGAPPGPGTLVCTVHQAVMGQLRRLADTNGLALVSVRPFAATVWNLARSAILDTAASSAPAASAALIVVEDDAFTLFACGAGGLETVSTLGHRREPGLIDRELRRVALGAGSVHLAMPAHLDAMAPAAAAGALARPACLEREYYADFRDLPFRAAREAAA